MLRRFFTTCSGASSRLLDECPTERIKYIGIGATIFFTALMAALSGAFFISFAFTNPKTNIVELSNEVIILVSFAWGLLIFNIDRNLIISMRKTGNPKHELWQASLRLGLAIFIGFVISTPLELKIFAKEVEAQMNKEITAVAEADKLRIRMLEMPVRLRADSIISKMDADLEKLQDRKDQLYDEMRKEGDGEAGTMIQGAGPIFKAKKLAFEQADSLYKSEKKKLENQRKVNEIEIAEQVKQVNEAKDKNEQGQGVGARITALYHSSWAHWFITILFILIEILPVLTKLLSKRGPYDEIMERIEHRHAVEHQLDISRINDEANRSLELTMAVNKKKLEVDMANEIELLDLESKKNSDISRAKETRHGDIVNKEVSEWFQEQMRGDENVSDQEEADPVVNTVWKVSNTTENIYYIFRNGNVARNELVYLKDNDTPVLGGWSYIEKHKLISIDLFNNQVKYEIIDLKTGSMKLKNQQNEIELLGT
jgi:Domain of unknown function (DUF4407)